MRGRGIGTARGRATIMRGEYSIGFLGFQLLLTDDLPFLFLFRRPAPFFFTNGGCMLSQRWLISLIILGSVALPVHHTFLSIRLPPHSSSYSQR